MAAVTGQGTVAGLAALLALLVAWHIGLGSDLYVLGVMTLISALGIVRLRAARLWFSDFLVIGVALYSGGLTLGIKGMLGQPLQQNLHHPQQAATVLLAGFGMFWGLSALARAVAAGRQFPLADRLEDPVLQRRVFLPLLALGLLFVGLHVALRPRLVDGVLDAGPGFGGFGSLTFVLTLALSLGMALALRGAGNGPGLMLVGVGAAMLLLSVASNTKRELAEFVLVLGAGFFLFGQRPRLLHVLAGGGLAAVLLLYAAPVIHLMRGSFAELGLFGRMALGWEILVQHGFSAAELRAAEGQFLTGFTHAWSESGSYIWPSTLGLDRFMLILPVDQVLRGQEALPAIGPIPFLAKVVEGVLPSALVAKTAYVGADLVAWEYGIRQYGNSARPVIGFAASALAAGGMAGVILMPVMVALPLMLAGNLLFGPLRGRAIGIFLGVSSWVLPEYTIDALAVFGLRPFVLMVAAIWLVARFGQPRQRAKEA